MRRTGLFLGTLAIACFVSASQAAALGWRIPWRFASANSGSYDVSLPQDTSSHLERSDSLRTAEERRIGERADPYVRKIDPTDQEAEPYCVYGTWKCWDDEGDRECGWDYTNFDRPRDYNYSPEHDPDS